MSFRASSQPMLSERVGPYVLVKAIGAGGSARVDLARIERAYGFQRHVVVKRPLEHLRGEPRAAESIRREARLGARLRHPNLIAILDAGVHEGYDYLVLEYVHGGALRTLMQADEASRVRDVSLEVALSVVRDIARGVHEAHELKDERGASLGLVHRDVSPGNVLVGLDGAVKLADFGIAKETRVATLSGSMHGTVTYMAPEQCRGHAFDRRADVFSIGVILYELVTGTRLFWADNDVASLHRVLEGNIIRPRRVRANVPQQLEDLIMTALAVEQDKRVPTARALADAIESYASEAGLILAARGVSRWAHELLGPRDAPWVGDQTVIERAIPSAPPEPEDLSGSLVEIIESTPVPQMLPMPTFGPSDGTMPEDIAVVPARPPRKRRGALVVAALGSCLAVGGAIALATARSGGGVAAQHDEPAAAPAVAPTPAPTPAPAPAPAPEPKVAPSVAPAVEPEPTVPAEPEKAAASEPDVAEPAPKSAHKRIRRHTTKRDTKTVDKAGTGSGATSHGNVVWDPKILMPTDSKKKH